MRNLLIGMALYLPFPIAGASDTSLYARDYEDLEDSRVKVLNLRQELLVEYHKYEEALAQITKLKISPNDIKSGQYKGELAEEYLRANSYSERLSSRIDEENKNAYLIVARLYGKYKRVSELCGIRFPDVEVSYFRKIVSRVYPDFSSKIQDAFDSNYLEFPITHVSSSACDEQVLINARMTTANAVFEAGISNAFSQMHGSASP